MAESHSRGGQASITITPAAPERIVILFHGYTGSPGEFGELPAHLSRELNATVHIPLLPGHGTRVEDLFGITYTDFVNAAFNVVNSYQNSGLPIAIGGHSFGGYLAMEIAARTQSRALFATVTPYHMRWKYSLPLLWLLGKIRPLWNKRLHPHELRERTRVGSYTKMPADGLALVYEGNRRIPLVLESVKCPILAIHAEHDLLALPSSAEAIIKHSNAQIKQSHIIRNGKHGLFYSPDAYIIRDVITQFLKDAF